MSENTTDDKDGGGSRILAVEETSTTFTVSDGVEYCRMAPGVVKSINRRYDPLATELKTTRENEQSEVALFEYIIIIDGDEDQNALATLLPLKYTR